MLLDIDEPAKVIGRTPVPILQPVEGEEFGYVPNVMYSCGSLVHEGNLVVPYGFADRGIRFAVMPVDEVLSSMT